MGHYQRREIHLKFIRSRNHRGRNYFPPRSNAYIQKNRVLSRKKKAITRPYLRNFYILSKWNARARDAGPMRVHHPENSREIVVNDHTVA